MFWLDFFDHLGACWKLSWFKVNERAQRDDLFSGRRHIRDVNSECVIKCVSLGSISVCEGRA